MLNKIGKSGHPCLVPDHRGNAFSFSPLSMMLAVDLSFMGFVMLKYDPSMGFLGGAVVKNPPAIAGDVVQSLGREDPLEKEMATHSSILSWRIPWTEEPGELQYMGLQSRI